MVQSHKASLSHQDSYGSDPNSGPPRKKMRKGTKSCIECRRRKIKCVYEPENSGICNECHTRGTSCVDQEHGDISSFTQPNQDQVAYSLRERVSQLEDLVRHVLNKPDGSRASSPGQLDNQAGNLPHSLLSSDTDASPAEVLKSLKASSPAAADETMLMPTGLRQDAPAMTLFDNAVITRKLSETVVSKASQNKSKAIIAALSQLLPVKEDFDRIMNVTQDWWTFRRLFPQTAEMSTEQINEEVYSLLKSDKPAGMARTMLALAMCMHSIPTDMFSKQTSGKEEPVVTMIDRWVHAIGKLVTSDDELMAETEGIECLLLEAKYSVNFGRPRRAWLSARRAVAFCQLLGFHRLASQKPSKPDPVYDRQVLVWTHICMTDRFLSLLLGLPYSVSEAFITPYLPKPNTPGRPLGESYVMQLIPIVTKMIDRNQAVVPLGYSATLQLDQEMEELANVQGPEFWKTDNQMEMATVDYFDKVQAQFFHHQTRVFLHMPFMLQASKEKRYQYSHTATLESAREMIRIWDALRTSNSVGPFICKLVDFEAFTAAMLLLLNLCGYSQHRRSGPPQQADLEQDQKDSELIDRTITLLHECAKEGGGIVASQSAQALEMLGRARHGCPEGGQHHGSVQVSVPFFGTITIGQGNDFVPIPAGTYPVPGPARTQALPAYRKMSATGLPTPSSSSTTRSTQPSPMTSTIDNPHAPSSATSASGYAGSTTSSIRHSLFDQTADYITPGLNNWSSNGPDDQFVNFDSFMALPPNSFDFSAGTMSTGFPSQSAPFMAGVGSAGSMNAPGANGFPFPNFPFAMPPGGGTVDLDHSWDFFGADGPLYQ